MPIRFGRDARTPIWETVAFIARAYGVMKFSLRPSMMLANIPSSVEYLMLFFILSSMQKRPYDPFE